MSFIIPGIANNSTPLCCTPLMFDIYPCLSSHKSKLTGNAFTSYFKPPLIPPNNKLSVSFCLRSFGIVIIIFNGSRNQVLLKFMPAKYSSIISFNKRGIFTSFASEYALKSSINCSFIRNVYCTLLVGSFKYMSMSPALYYHFGT